MSELKNIKFSWTKWGRTNTGTEKRDPVWFCQSCNQQQPDGIDPFLFKIGDNEYIRICHSCQNNKVTLEITTLTALIIVCRPKSNWIDHA